VDGMTKEQFLIGLLWGSQVGAFIGAFFGVKTHVFWGLPPQWGAGIGGFIGSLVATTLLSWVFVWALTP